jgi:hypothetical protein
MKKEDARVLYQTAAKLHEHFYRVVWTYTGFAITINVGIWSYLLKSYVDSITATTPQGNPLFIGIAAAISSIVFGVWRYHNRWVDDSSFTVFTDLLRYEMKARVPEYSGTQGYLIRTRPQIEQIFADNTLSDEKKLQVINILIRDKHMGWKGGLILEWGFFALIYAMFIVALCLFAQHQFLTGLENFLVILCKIGILIGLFIVLIEIIIYHVEPDKNSVEKAIREAKNMN